MKFAVMKSVIKEMASRVGKAVSTKSTLPILGGILIEVRNDKLIITGNDLETTIEDSTSDFENLGEDGSVVLDYRMFNTIVNANNKYELYTIELINDGRTVYIQNGTCEYSLQVLSASEFPTTPKIGEGTSIKIKGELLKSMVSKVIGSVAVDSTRPLLTGVHLELENKVLNLVALDGFRVAHAFENIGVEGKIKVTLPAKSISDLAKIVGAGDDILLSFTDRHLLAEVGTTTIVTRMLEGDYINYKSLFPAKKDIKTHFKACGEEFTSKIKNINLFVKEGESCTFHMMLKGDKIRVKAKSSIGIAKDDYIGKVEGENLLISFNSKFFLDGIRSVSTDELYVGFTGEYAPCVMVTKENNFKYLLLPHRDLEREQDLKELEEM